MTTTPEASRDPRDGLPTTAVILSTYNAPKLLERVLAGYSVQTDKNFRIVIADDGSGTETRELIERARSQWFPNLLHVWHEDVGFRKCEILNKAIIAASESYMIFSDGDCIPRPDFVHTHRSLAKPGRFLTGGYLLLPTHVCEAITLDDVLAQRVVQMRALQQRGLRFSLRHWARLLPLSPLTITLDAINPSKRNWNGHNASGWRKDLIAIGGFDQRMEWGGEDREFGMRLVHSGVRGKHIRYQAPVIHLDHGRGYIREEALKRNAEIRSNTKRTRATYTEHGIPAGTP